MDYVWTGMCTTIKKWLNQCVTCKLFSQQQPYTPPQSMPIPSYPFQFISIDLVGPLPQTFHGYQYILTLIDHLTGWADVFPITNKRGSTIADILVDRVFPQYGFPETSLSDNGTEFINTDVRNVCKAFGILHKHSTVFHPNSNGKIERFHRTFEQIIAKFAQENNTNWLKQLPAALNAYRTTTYGATGQTPFQTLYGGPARLPRQTLQHVDVPDARISTQVASWSAASENIEHSQRQNQQRARQTRLAPILKPGDHVAVKVEGHVGTFKPLWTDFYVITKSKHPTYYIRHLVSGKERVLHREKLIQLPKADPTPELRTAYSKEDDYIDEDDSDGRVAPHVRVQGGESPPIAQTHSLPNSPSAAELALVTPPPGEDQSPANRNATPLLSLHSKAQSPPITPVVPDRSADTSVADTPPPPVRLLFSRRPQRTCRESETTWTCRPAS